MPCLPPPAKLPRPLSCRSAAPATPPAAGHRMMAKRRAILTTDFDNCLTSSSFCASCEFKVSRAATCSRRMRPADVHAVRPGQASRLLRRTELVVNGLHPLRRGQRCRKLCFHLTLFPSVRLLRHLQLRERALIGLLIHQHPVRARARLRFLLMHTRQQRWCALVLLHQELVLLLDQHSLRRMRTSRRERNEREREGRRGLERGRQCWYGALT